MSSSPRKPSRTAEDRAESASRASPSTPVELSYEVLERALGELLPESQVLGVRALGVDESSQEAVVKAMGYGRPLLVDVKRASGVRERLVFHTAAANPFGHERRADRAAEMLLAYDTFGSIPKHTAALDVGVALPKTGKLISLKDAGEFYLITQYLPGRLYAKELAELAERQLLIESDRHHTRSLAAYLADLHARQLDDAVGYTRAARDLVGSGEGIFGIIDGYPTDADPRLLERLRAIEHSCVDWRWRLKRQTRRARRIHGDFHPFNILFGEDDELQLLDTSRGSLGDPADDVSCLSINYIFFALNEPSGWRTAFRELWQIFWREYLERSRDAEVRSWVAPYFAWRSLVLASPAWYSGLSDHARAGLLDFCERCLNAAEFDPSFADAVFA